MRNGTVWQQCYHYCYFSNLLSLLPTEWRMCIVFLNRTDFRLVEINRFFIFIHVFCERIQVYSCSEMSLWLCTESRKEFERIWWNLSCFWIGSWASWTIAWIQIHAVVDIIEILTLNLFMSWYSLHVAMDYQFSVELYNRVFIEIIF